MLGYNDGPRKNTHADFIVAALFGLSMIGIGTWSIYKDRGETALVWGASFVAVWAIGIIWRLRRIAKGPTD